MGGQAELARRLGQAAGLVAVGKVVCSEIDHAFGVRRCVVSYFGASGRPVIVVDNLQDVTDDERLACSIGGVPPGTSRYGLVLPLVAPGGMLGSIYCERDESFSRELERALFVLGTQVSVRLVLLGVTSPAGARGTAALTRRQHEVASLAARGATNREIAAELGISTNTVKNRLKQVFDRLRVSSRVELVRALPRTPPREDLPLGITRDGALTITRLADALA